MTFGPAEQAVTVASWTMPFQIADRAADLFILGVQQNASRTGYMTPSAADSLTK
jgi:hypothetical protein